jgi:hypothetical protein
MNSRLLTRLGWLLFALGWIPFAGIFIGMIGFPEGSYTWAELPKLMRYSMIATFVTFGFAMLVLFGSPLLSWWTNRRVRREGQRATANVLEMWDTGTTINENPVVGLRLEVHPIAGAPFVAETQQLISRLRVQEYKPGTQVDVRYDPDTKEVALLEEKLGSSE